jgi:hypothetical protein
LLLAGRRLSCWGFELLADHAVLVQYMLWELTVVMLLHAGLTTGEEALASA